ncbi:hypothetical protein M885DRAFT_1919 [Pelagophyceae sp. CCMP2097]|nr:hypothetical protein M885DRAFT_1919 [Pelagophyceae sp. CCMP2097]
MANCPDLQLMEARGQKAKATFAPFAVCTFWDRPRWRPSLAPPQKSPPLKVVPGGAAGRQGPGRKKGPGVKKSGKLATFPWGKNPVGQKSLRRSLQGTCATSARRPSLWIGACTSNLPKGSMPRDPGKGRTPEKRTRAVCQRSAQGPFGGLRPHLDKAAEFDPACAAPGRFRAGKHLDASKGQTIRCIGASAEIKEPFAKPVFEDAYDSKAVSTLGNPQRPPRRTRKNALAAVKRPPWQRPCGTKVTKIKGTTDAHCRDYVPV